MILAELSLVFGVVFAWGFHELRDVKRYRNERLKSPAERGSLQDTDQKHIVQATTSRQIASTTVETSLSKEVDT